MRIFINILCMAIPLPNIRRLTRNKLQNIWWAYTNNLNKFSRCFTGRPVIVWFDHALGGGTEVYSKRQFAKLCPDFDVLRVQYMPATQQYHMTMANRPGCPLATQNISEIADFICQLNVGQIVVNNLVGYQNTLATLDVIRNIVNKCSVRPHVSFRGHDYQSICPSFNLINCDGKYCNMRYRGGCEKCWAQKKMSDNDATDKVLKSGAGTICDWRKKWGNFFDDTVDEIVVFSDSVAKIFKSVYPKIADKIVVIPHEVRLYSQAKIKPHQGINIVTLGNMSHQKGADVIRQMAESLPKNSDINIIVVGKMYNAPQNVHVHGKYDAEQLVRIMEHYDTDIVLIPSIWPETFSYTTSEAMSMGLPVACFDMGAHAERVAKYNQGLVMQNIAPKKNIEQIFNFIKELKK